MENVENDSEFLLKLAKSIISIHYTELTFVEKAIFTRFEKKGVLKRDQYDEVSLGDKAGD